MAWDDEIDPTEPADTDDASSGDDEIRTLKRALIERLASRLAGFPETDPLFISAADVGDIAARPALPTIDGQVFIQHTPAPKKIFYGLGGAWFELAVGSGSGTPASEIPPPINVNFQELSSCVGAAPVYLQRFIWTDNAGPTGATAIFVNGVEYDQVAYDVETYDFDPPLAPGIYIVGIAHRVAGVLSNITTSSQTVVNPCSSSGVGPLFGFYTANYSSCLAGPTPDYEVHVFFTKGTDLGVKVRIKRNGVERTLTDVGFAGPYVDRLGLAPGTYTYEGRAVSVPGGVEGPPLTSQITITNPCTDPVLQPPTALDVEEQGVCVGDSSNNAVRISWTVHDPLLPVRLYKEHLGDAAALLVTLPAGTAAYTDEGVDVDETYNYWVTHWDDPAESTSSGSVVYTALDLCGPEE